MNAATITMCAQCPTCRTYVALPPNILDSLKHASHPAIPAQSLASQRVIPPSNPEIYDGTLGTVYQPVERTINAPAYSLSEYENSWRAQFREMPVLIHGITELILAVLIIILEIVSLGLSTYAATGAGIWCGIPFITAAISTIRLVKRWDRSRLWATRVLIAQIILFIFSLILIGIVGSFVSSNKDINSVFTSYGVTTSYGNHFNVKYQIMQAQLAFAVLLMFAGLAYIIFYCVVTYLALWKPYKTLDTPHLFRE